MLRALVRLVCLVVVLAGSPASASAEPVSVWVVGDSTALPLEQGFAARRKTGSALKVRTFFKNSSGLLRPDLIDWPKIIKAQLQHGAPDVAVLTFGANDAQGLVVPGQRWPVPMGTEEWRAEYGRRVRAFVDLFLARGVEVYLLLQPFDADKKHAPLMRDVNAGLARATEPKTERLHLLDVPAWLEEAAPERGVDAPRLKNKDGIHLTFAGGKWLSERLETSIAHDRATLAENR